MSVKHEPAPPAVHLIIAVAVIGFLITVSQTLLIFFRGNAFCLNEGCEIVESLTVVPPLFFNLAGAVYFFSIFICFVRGRNGSRFWLTFGRLLLLSGMAAEGVLICFQHYVAQTFCSYCLIVFSLICLMTIFAGLRQVIAGFFVFAAVLTAFSSLQFSPAGSSKEILLDEGTFARLEGDMDAGKMYLFYSATCVHCEEVIGTLDEEFTCGLQFNPVGEVEAVPANDAALTSGYVPEVNRNYLKNLGIRSIPVLTIQTDREIRVLKGKKPILDYLDEKCRSKAVAEIGQEQSSIISGQSSAIIPNGVFYAAPGEDESCAVEQDCEDELPKNGGQ